MKVGVENYRRFNGMKIPSMKARTKVLASFEAGMNLPNLPWHVNITSLRASSYDPGNRAGSVTGMNFVVCSYGKFQPGYRDEIQETKPKWRHINKYCSRLS